jgi:hypothetical protein
LHRGAGFYPVPNTFETTTKICPRLATASNLREKPCFPGKPDLGCPAGKLPFVAMHHHLRCARAE